SAGSEAHSNAELAERYAVSAEDWEWLPRIFKPSLSALGFFLGAGECGRDQLGYRPGRRADRVRPAAPKCTSRPRVPAAARDARVVRAHPAAARRTVRALRVDRRKARYVRNAVPGPKARQPC